MRSFAPLPALLLLFACGAESPEGQVRKVFAEAVKAVEEGDAPGAAELLHEGFRGPEGMNRAEARLYLLGWLRREKVGVTVLSQQVRVQGPQAEQAVEILLTGTSPGRLLPEDGSRKSLVLRWVRVGRNWRIREIQVAGGG